MDKDDSEPEFEDETDSDVDGGLDKGPGLSKRKKGSD